MKYQNTGAAFQRQDGSTCARGDIFEPTELELRKLAYKLRPAPDNVAVTPRAPAPAPRPRQEAAPPAPPPPATPGWPLAMGPELYLRLYPQGPRAALARQVLGLAPEAADGGTD